MTNKKFKVAAMSMALTACVAAQPLIANAADEVDVNSNDANVSAPQEEQEANSSSEDTRTNDEIKEDNAKIDEKNQETAESNKETAESNKETAAKNDESSGTGLPAVDDFEGVLPNPNQSDESYNKDVEKYNEAVDKSNEQVADHNAAVDKYNEAASQGNQATDQEVEKKETGDPDAENPEEQTGSNVQKDEQNKQNVSDNNKLIDGTDAELEAPETLLDKPELPGDFDSLSVDEKNAALDAYNDAINAYNDAVNNYNEETLAAYKAAIEEYNSEIRQSIKNQETANNTINTANQKVLDKVNAGLKLNLNNLEAPSINYDELDAGTQAAVLEKYNAAVEAYNKLVAADNANIAKAYEDYVAAIKEYNQSLADTANTDNTTKNDENQTEIDSALTLLEIIGKNDDNLPALDGVSAPQKPTLTGNYDEDVKLVTAYNNTVRAYNKLVAGEDGNGGYNASVEGYNATLAAYADTLAAANAEQIQANKDSANAAVGGIDIVIKSNDETSDTIIKTAYNADRLSDYHFSSLKDAKEEFAKRKNAVTTHQTKMAEALEALEAAVDESGKVTDAEAYAQAVKGYNQAVDGIKAAIISYNEFVGKCNVQSDGVPSTKPTETKEYKLDKLYTDKWTKNKTYTTSSGTYRGDWSTATYYIQIQGTIPIEEGTTGHDSAGYVKAGAGAVADATIYSENYNSLTGEVRDDYNRIDIPSSYGIISSNAYNNEVINLDHLVDANGNPLGGEDATLSAKLQAYYANVYKVLIDGKATNRIGTKTYSVPTADDAIKAMYANGKMDSVTYQAYLDSVKKGTPSLDVVWYVIKDNRTNGNTVQWDGVHVDGAVFFTDTGIIYDKNKLTAINAEFDTLKDLPATKLSELQKLDPIKVDSLKKADETLNAKVTELKTIMADTMKTPDESLNAKVTELKTIMADTMKTPDESLNATVTELKTITADTMKTPDKNLNATVTELKTITADTMKTPADFNGSLNPLNPITADSMKDSDDLKKLTELDTIDGRYIEQLGKLDPLSPIDPVVPSDEDDDSDDDFVVIVVPVDVPETMVQDAKPDAPVLPADPALPAVQDAHALPAVQGAHALPQTGVNWLAAIGLALSGMTLMITGAFASLTGKNAKH